MEITVKRHFDLIHCFAKYKVYADDRVIGEVSNGKTESFTIPDDTNHIYLASKRYYSPKTSCEVNKNSDYEVGADRLPKIAFLFLIIFGFLLLIDAAYTHINIKYYGGLLILALFLIMYARINGIDKYIRFTDKDSNTVTTLGSNKLF